MLYMPHPYGSMLNRMTHPLTHLGDGSWSMERGPRIHPAHCPRRPITPRAPESDLPRVIGRPPQAPRTPAHPYQRAPNPCQRASVP